METWRNLGDRAKLASFLAINLHAEIVEVEIEVVSPSIVPSGNFAELNRTVTCMVLKTNDRRTSCPCHDEFRGPRSDYVRQKIPEGSELAKMVTYVAKVAKVVPTWSPKMMPTWLYRQDFANFSLNCHYNPVPSTHVDQCFTDEFKNNINRGHHLKENVQLE
ncbi:hypothetical protein TNCV_482171 [Trichonephila clavipes]|uniref:Uncharacterized protein n=1 Tax=Trichonephila clavipes TaxID=2585209 RepID=A0A8X6S3H9_TRICX|nr:hypothetical protein TNCV_482171 [Trichonephila clavipes]